MLDFPYPTALGVVSRHYEARDLFAPLIKNVGCTLLFSFYFEVCGERCGHSVVSESCDDEGVTALCSGPGGYAGEMVKWSYTEEDKREPGDCAHGRRIVVPWRTQGYDEWFELGPNGGSLGIGRDYVIVFR